MEDLIWVRADNCFYSLMWPRQSQTNKESSHQILHLRQDPCQQNTLALFRFILLSIFPCVVGAHCWKVIVAIISRALAWGSSSQNSSCITQSFPRGMSEMCGKYNTALIFSWYCSDWLPACSGANKTLCTSVVSQQSLMFGMMKFDNVWYVDWHSTCWAGFNEGCDRRHCDDICITKTRLRGIDYFITRLQTFLFISI